jgi:sterol desaturase/sphingolipid hydroxylase (fatty acid hydroxylase superfamily)
VKAGRLAGVLVAGLALGLWVGERRRPLRAPPLEPNRHDLRNAVIAALSAATVTLVQAPLVGPLSQAVERRRLGLLQKLPGPEWVRTTAAVLLMDYSLYGWHVLTHRTPWLWRLHATHHSDRHLTASTALRFHFLEMAASVPYRALQVRLLGVGPGALGLWQNLTLGAILFHHSNLRLPNELERVIGWVLATPRMHGITIRPTARSGTQLVQRPVCLGPPSRHPAAGPAAGPAPHRRPGCRSNLSVPEALHLPLTPEGRR